MPEWVEDTFTRAIELLARQGRADLASDLQRLAEVIDTDEVDALRLAEAEAIVEDLFDISSVAELSAILERTASVFNVQHCTLCVIGENSGNTLAAKIVTTYDQDWIRRYVECDYENIDPVLTHSRKATDGFYWHETASNSPRVVRFLDDAKAYGVGSAGFTAIVETLGGDRFSLNVCCDEDEDAFLERFQPIRSDFEEVALDIANTFFRVSTGNRPTITDPSPDQLRLLRSVAIGANTEEMQSIPFASGSFASVEASVLKTFHSRTLAEAAVIAARIGLLNETPLMLNEIYASPGSRRSAPEPVVQSNITLIKRRARRRKAVA